DRRPEDMKIADFPKASHGFLAFEAIDHGLNGRIGRPVFFRKSLLDFTDGSFLVVPKHFHDLKFELGEFGQAHKDSITTSVCESTTFVCVVKKFFQQQSGEHADIKISACLPLFYADER